MKGKSKNLKEERATSFYLFKVKKRVVKAFRWDLIFDHLVRMMVHNLLWPDGKEAVLEKKAKWKIKREAICKRSKTETLERKKDLGF